MSFFRMPLLVWANFSTSLLVVIATPFIAASQFFVLLDRALGFHFFDAFVGAGKNGNVIMYQHVFWFYSHPAVYIMMLPGFGIISEILAVKARKPIFGYRMMAFSLLAIVVLGFTVWAHHMFVSGMQPWIRIPMMITTAIIAIPTGIKIFSWLATLWRGVLHLDTPMLFALGFLTMFTLGGISGVMLAMIPFDIHVSQTYFIVAHIHYVLFGGSLFTIFAGVYYWFPKMTGRMFDDRLGKRHFWLTFIFFNLTFGPMHLIGIQGMPRRVAEYAQQFAAWNLIISLSTLRARPEHAGLPLQHGRQLARRPARGGQPVARADARVAGLLTAADLQLRRGPDGRRRSLRVRRARARCTGSSSRRPRRSAVAAGAFAAPPSRADPTRRGVIDEDRPGRRQRDARRTAADRRCAQARRPSGDVRFVLCVPQTKPRAGLVIYDDAVFDAAQARVDLALEFLASARASRRSARSAIRIRTRRRWTPSASTTRTRSSSPRYPETRSGWLRRDLIDRVRDASGLPVEHVVADLDTEGLPFQVTLAVANRTASGDELLEALKAKARDAADEQQRCSSSSCPRRAATAAPPGVPAPA